MKHMLKITADLKERFNKIFAAIFLAFLFFMLSFGRAFSIINIKGIFITEIILFIGVFFILFNGENMFEIPRNFLIIISVYFALGCIYFLKGALEKNIYVLRDIVFFAYTLFVPLVFLFFKDKQSLKKFALILIASNVIGLISSRYHFCSSIKSKLIEESIGIIRPFNYLLYFGITLSFLISLFYLVKKRSHKILIVILCVLNIYISILWAERSGWVALFMVFVFMGIFLKKRFLKFSLYFLIAFLAISTILLVFMDSYFFKSVFLPKVKSTGLFIKDRTVAGTQQNKIKVPRSFIEDWGIEEDSSIFEVTEGLKEDRERSFYVNLGWRMEMWKLAIKAGMKSPMLGKGYGALLIPARQFRTARQIGVSSDYIPLHNHILSIFYKMGFIGLALFFFINIYAFLYGYRYIKEAKSDFTKFFLLGCLGSLIYWHALAFFVNAIDSPPTSIFLWIIIGLIFACVRADSKQDYLSQTDKKES